MAGILDVKRRIIDALITQDGRRQMANGTISLNYASFSDEGIFYDSEDGESARDISNLPIFEVVSLPRDIIIPEVDDDGTFSLSLSDGNKIVNGRKVISGSFDVVTTDSNGVRTVVQAEPVLTGALNVYSGTLDILRTAVNHFSQLNVIATDGGLKESSFSVGTNTVKLTTIEKKISMSAVKPLLFNNSINHTINTRYLPPFCQNAATDSGPLGDYPKFTTAPYNNFSSFKEQELKDSISSQEIIINSHASSNNLIGQFIETNKDVVDKLVIVDYGEFINEENVKHRVFYLGKPIRDLSGNPKFCRLFTLVFEK